MDGIQHSHQVIKGIFELSHTFDRSLYDLGLNPNPEQFFSCKTVKTYPVNGLEVLGLNTALLLGLNLLHSGNRKVSCGGYSRLVVMGSKLACSMGKNGWKKQQAKRRP